MPIKDLRSWKGRRREEIKAMRRALVPEEKALLDQRVRQNVMRLHQYRRARVLIVYMSTPIEVDTRALIERALAGGKRVALPRCVPGTRLMDFYFITSLEDLERGTFGVLEPKTSCELLTGFEESVCVVPALSYDHGGYRLGYGGGYYDRFLSAYTGPKVGVIYSCNLCRALPHGRFDQPVDLVATDRGFFYTRAKRAAHATAAKREQHRPRMGRHKSSFGKK